MEKTIKALFAFTLLASILLFSGCSGGPAEEPVEQPIAGQNEERLKYANLTDDLIAAKQDPAKGIDIYKKLVEIFPVNDEYRQKLLRYLLDESQALINSKNLEDVQKGLDLSLRLHEIIPGDFYIQNRILGAYKRFAEEEMEAKNWTKAKEWTQKGLRIRFDNMVMKTHLKILIKEAEEFIKEKKYTEAKANLDSVLEIASIPDNKDLFTEEASSAQSLTQKIPQ